MANEIKVTGYKPYVDDVVRAHVAKLLKASMTGSSKE
jgi:pyruvate/oxaloacetate carboxyltransferase